MFREENTILADNKKSPDNNRQKVTAENKKSNQTRTAESVGFTRAVPVILIAVALFLTLCFLTADTGAFGAFISSALLGLFSYMAYTIPLFISLHALFYFADLKRGKVFTRVLFSLGALVMLSMTAYVISTFNTEAVFDIAKFYSSGIERVGGGAIGSMLAYFFMKIFGRIGLIILLTLALVIYVIYLASGGGSAISTFFLKKLRSIANFAAGIERRVEERRKKKRESEEKKYRAFDDKKNKDFYNDEYFSTDNGMSRLEIPELGILETKSTTGGAYVLRQTVIKNDEDDKEYTSKTNATDSETAYRKSKLNDIFIDTETSFVRASNNLEGFKSDDIVYEAREGSFDRSEPEFDAKADHSETKNARDYGIDDSAEAIFTEDFDPYDIAMNERLKNKPSSRANEIDGGSVKGFSEYLSSMTPEEAEHLKRLERFEESKRAALARRTAEISATETPTSTVTSNANEYDAREDALKKAEETRRKEQERLASFGSGAFAEKKEEPKTTDYSASNSFISSAYTTESTHEPRVNTSENSSYRFINNVTEEVRIPYTATEPAVKESLGYATEEEKRYSPSNTHYAESAAEPKTYSVPEENTYRNQNSNAEYGTFEVSEKVESKERYSAPVQQPTYSVTVTPEPEIKTNLSFVQDDTDEAQDLPITENSTEFNFDTEDEDDLAPIPEISENDGELLEVSRSMIEPEPEAPIYEEKVGLDFSFDDNEEDDASVIPSVDSDEDDDIEDEEKEDFSEEDAEEAIEPTLIPEEERNPDVDGYRSMFTIFNDDKNDTEDMDENTDSEYTDADTDSKDEDDEPPFDEYDEVTDEDEPPIEAPVPEKKAEKPKAKKVIDYSRYKFPPLDLLKKSPEEDWDTINREIQYGGEQLINTLDSFNIKATIRGMEHGPRITRYSIVPAKGIRVNQIEKLADDIALALAAESIRIEAPIPGKSAVGVEVPNKVSSLVTLRDLLESEEFMNEPSKTSVCIGKSVEGSLVYGDIGTMPHVLIAGATGMGKSVCINALITSILYKARPDEVKFIMIDPKKVEFAPYTGLPHLLIPVVTDPKQAAGALMWAVDEMNKRYEIIEKLRVKNIDSYNRKVAEDPELGAPMSKIVIFIDELNDLMVQVRDPVENLIMLLAQKSRAAGIHLVIGTQRPSVDVLTGVIKANIPTRIACKVSSGIDSRTILEKTGAEKLIGKGDMLFAFPGKEPKRVQGAFVSDGETEAIVDFIKAQVDGEVYDEQALEDIKRAAQKCDKSKNGDDGLDDDDDEGSGVGYLHDRKFLNAVELAVRNGSVATSFLQRKLHIGYGKAAQYIDIMEDLGIVGEKNGSKARDVLVSMNEWNEKLARLTEDY